MNIQQAIEARKAHQLVFDDIAPEDAQQEELPLNPREVIGGNNPPVLIALEQKFSSPKIDSARDAYRHTAQFLHDTPVIQTQTDAAKAANLLEQARKTVQDIEAERRQAVDPLNAEVKRINDIYRSPRETIEKLVEELKRRLKAFADAVEAARIAEAERLMAAAQEAERIAREAEEREREARAEADAGVLVDVAGASAQADLAFAAFQKTARAAVRADNATTLRIDGGFDRAVSMRKSETLVLDDAIAALQVMGVNDKVRDAILSAARAYRKLNGSLPAGVRAETERKF